MGGQELVGFFEPGRERGALLVVGLNRLGELSIVRQQFRAAFLVLLGEVRVLRADFWGEGVFITNALEFGLGGIGVVCIDTPLFYVREEGLK